MSKLAPWIDAIAKAQQRFETMAAAHSAVNWAAEANFARQVIQLNDYARRIATDNPRSLCDAMINVGAIGLTLNPAEALAYLVPRDGRIILDISYRGLIRLATDTGSVRWAKAEIVRDKDRFVYHGPASMPTHEMNPFADRGEMIGVYCIAKTIDGDILVDVMGLDEIHKTRDTSMAYKSGKANPWTTWPEEMAKKTIIKRASKTWPRSKQTRRYDHAVAVLNDHEGIDTHPGVSSVVRAYRDGKDSEWTPDQIEQIKNDFIDQLESGANPFQGANNAEKGGIRKLVQDGILNAPRQSIQTEATAHALLTAHVEGNGARAAECLHELDKDEQQRVWLLIDNKTGQDLRAWAYEHREAAA